MNVHFSYKISKTSDLEKLINQQVEKLGRYLRVFRPDLVHLKGLIEESSAREGVVVSLNLRLPSGQMAAQEKSPTADGRHQGRLRFDCRAGQEAQGAAAHHHKGRRQDRAPSRYRALRRHHGGRQARAHFQRRHCELRQRQSAASATLRPTRDRLPREPGQLQPGQVVVEDVVGEAIANALSEQHESPEPMKLEPWVHRLAMRRLTSLRWRTVRTGTSRWNARTGSRTCMPAMKPICNSISPTSSCRKKMSFPTPPPTILKSWRRGTN